MKIILQFVKFFFLSTFGLVVVLFTPFSRTKNNLLLFFFLLFGFIFFYLIINQMIN